MAETRGARAARFQARAAVRLPQLVRNAMDRGSLPILVALILLLVALCMPAAELPRGTYTYPVCPHITQSMKVQAYELDGSSGSRRLYPRPAVKRAVRALPCGSR